MDACRSVRSSTSHTLVGGAWMPALFFGEAPPIPRAETSIIIPIIVVPTMPVTVAMAVTGECHRRKDHRG